MEQIEQPIATPRRVSAEDSCETLQRIIKYLEDYGILPEIKEYATNCKDPKLEMFCTALVHKINEKIECNEYIISCKNDEKEEEPSPQYNDEKDRKICAEWTNKIGESRITDAHNITEVIPADPVDDDCKLNELATELTQPLDEESDDDVFDPSSDADLSPLSQMKENTLKEAETEIKVMIKINEKVSGEIDSKAGDKLNKDAVEFVPQSDKLLAINSNSNPLFTIVEGETIAEVEQEEIQSTPPSVSSISSPMTQSPSSESVSINTFNTSPITPAKPATMNPSSITNINNNVIINPLLSQQQMEQIFKQPSANLMFLSNPILTPNSVSITSPLPLSPLVPVISPISLSVPNQTIKPQSTPTNQCDAVQTEHKNDIGVTTQEQYKKHLHNYGYESMPNQQNIVNRDNDYNQFIQNAARENKAYFEPKFNNHAKGNFYISKEMIVRMVKECREPFRADNGDYDERLAFGYYKESVAMQINDGEINRIHNTQKGLIIIINIDLHFKDGKSMYLVATENDLPHRLKVRWQITAFMRGSELYDQYGITNNILPASSRNMRIFKKALLNPPTNIPPIYKYTNFKELPKKQSKRQTNVPLPRTSISQSDLKYYCRQSWNEGPVVPVVVIKGKKQWIEWKKFIQIYDEYEQEQWIGISLRYYPSNRKWKIECMDYDAGRIFYQHRLVGLAQNHRYNYSYDRLAGYITTALDIYY